VAHSPRQERDFLRLTDLSREELLELVERAAEWKLLGPSGPKPLQGMTVGLVFERPSIRTRISFGVACHHLGAGEMTVSAGDTPLELGEPIRDTARSLARYLDAIVLRTFDHARLEEMARFADVPVVNALSDSSHPCQLLADLLTVAERFGQDSLSRGDLTVAWVGEGNYLANSWLEACAVLGFRLRLACPEGSAPDGDLLARAGSRATLLRSARDAVAGAHVLNAAVWAGVAGSVGEAPRRSRFQGYRLDRDLVAVADPRAIVLHCLPAHRDEEIEDEVIEGPQSAVWDEAENRLHAQKALLELLLAARFR
jgi:ornithine carbamoyltransferase